MDGGSRAAAIARRLGLPTAGLTVGAARPLRRPSPTAEAQLHRTCDVLSLYLSAFSPTAVTTTLDDPDVRLAIGLQLRLDDAPPEPGR